MSVLLKPQSYPQAVKQVESTIKKLKERNYIAITSLDKEKISYHIINNTPLLAPTLAIKMIWKGQ